MLSAHIMAEFNGIHVHMHSYVHRCGFLLILDLLPYLLGTLILSFAVCSMENLEIRTYLLYI